MSDDIEVTGVQRLGGELLVFTTDGVYRLGQRESGPWQWSGCTRGVWWSDCDAYLLRPTMRNPTCGIPTCTAQDAQRAEGER